MLLDLSEYPGAEIVTNDRLTSPGMSPDEVRLLLVRKTSDTPDKVAKFFEKELSVIASGSGSHRELFGRTKRGNDVRVSVDSEGGITKYTLSAICYSK